MTMTGSTTTFGILRTRIRFATAPIISVRESIPVFGCDREVICDRIDLRSDKGGIEVGNAAHAALILRGYRGDGAGAEDGERCEGLEVRLDSRASAGIRACDGERNSGHGAWSLPRKLKVLLPAADFRYIALDAPGSRQSDRNDAAVFNAAMTSVSSVELSQIVAAYDFSKFEQIVDVGAGQGALLHGILSAYPNLRGVLIDLPSVVTGASVLPSGAIAGRCEVVGGDFFQAVPEGADAYLMRVVIHDWNDEDALRILRNCRRAIRTHGKLLMIESVLKPPNESDLARFNDLTMLVVAPGGKERTEEEFGKLLREAGFSLTRVITATGLTSIIESQPI